MSGLGGFAVRYDPLGRMHGIGIEPGDSMDDVLTLMRKEGFDPDAIDALSHGEGVAKARHSLRHLATGRFIPRDAASSAAAPAVVPPSSAGAPLPLPGIAHNQTRHVVIRYQ